MHSSRMRTTCSSSRLLEGGGLCLSTCWDTPPPGLGLDTPPGVGLDPPPRCGPGPLPQVGLNTEHPQPDPPTSPLGLGLDTPRPDPPPPGPVPRHPPCGQNSWHTLLKILPCPNFVACGNEHRFRQITGPDSGTAKQMQSVVASYRGPARNQFYSLVWRNCVCISRHFYFQLQREGSQVHLDDAVRGMIM